MTVSSGKCKMAATGVEAKQTAQAAAVSSTVAPATATGRQPVNLFKRSISLYLSITAILIVLVVVGILASLRISIGGMIFFLALCGFLVLELLTAVYIDRKGVSDL